MKRRVEKNRDWIGSLKDYEEIVNKELDNELMAKARKFNMTSKHVKDIIYRICSNKELIDFARRVAGSDRSTQHNRITRTKLKKIDLGKSKITDEEKEPYDFDIDQEGITQEENQNDSEYSNSGSSCSTVESSIDENNDRDNDHSEWLKWLAEMRQPDIPRCDEMEENDEDYLFLQDEMEEDDEEFRDDKAVVISQKEIKLLLDELDKEDIDFSITKSRVCLQSDPDEFPVISSEDRDAIVAQLQQHVQLLVQMYILATVYKINEPANRQAMYFLSEIFQFAPSPGKDHRKTISLFSKSNILQAMEVVYRWDRVLWENHIPLIFGSSPENGWKTHYNICVGSTMQVSCWTNFRFPPLPNKVMSFITTQSLFSLYPSLLPSCGIHILCPNQINYSDVDVGFTYSMNYDFNNFKIKFSPAENYLLLMGYFQFGENFELIEKHMLPSRLGQRIKFRFRWLISNPQKMEMDLRMMFIRGQVDINHMTCPLVKDISSPSTNLTLLSMADPPAFAPLWVNLLKEKRHWNALTVNYDFIENQTIRVGYQNEALSVLNMGVSVMIPDHIVFKRNLAFETPMYENPKIPIKNSVMTNPNLRTCSLYDIKNDIYALEQSYRRMTYLRAKEVKTDIKNLSETFSRVLLDILKDFHPEGDSYTHFLEAMKDIDCNNHSEVLNKLITNSKEHKTFLTYISYIFGLKDSSTSYRFWFEFIQLCRNLQEIQRALELNSYHHRKFLIFLSQLSSLNLPTMNIEEIQSLLPISLQSFRKIKLTDQMSVPSFFTIIQSYDREKPVNLVFEDMNDPPILTETDLTKPDNIILDASGKILPNEKKT